jgi:hypothetical protein
MLFKRFLIWNLTPYHSPILRDSIQQDHSIIETSSSKIKLNLNFPSHNFPIFYVHYFSLMNTFLSISAEYTATLLCLTHLQCVVLQSVWCLYARCQGYSLRVNPNTKARDRPPLEADSVATSRNMYAALSRTSSGLIDRTPNPRY